MSNNTTTTNNYNINSTVLNKGFLIVDQLFKENGWHLSKNEMDWIIYSKFGHELDYFEIKLDQSNIYVSVPIKNSPFQFKTTFKDYFLATEYIEDKFKHFISH